MNIPLDRLYQYIQNIAEEVYGGRVIIYRFWPHGSKNVNNLNTLDTSIKWIEKAIYPAMWCNDQEPLDYEFYKTNIRKKENPWSDLLKAVDLFEPPKNLNHNQTIFEKSLLLHSEQRSFNLNKYQQDNKLIPVYYWSHAVISRDWFRYAEHVAQKKQVTKIFLVYSRAWSGTREYRLKFAELLIRLGLENYCQASVNPIEPELGIHYKTHKFKNPAWCPTMPLENFFPISDAHSHYSADFDIEDYEATDIEVVLETLFDDGRLHLTEKSLRPIACGQPFILAGTHGSLEYLRRYGFVTFGDIWDESYDTITDPKERLYAITDLMAQIANWSPSTREGKLAEAQAIAEYNRQHFFSQDFFNQVVNELKINLQSAFVELKNGNNYTRWTTNWDTLLLHPKITEFLNSNDNTLMPTKAGVDQVISFIQNKKLFASSNKDTVPILR